MALGGYFLVDDWRNDMSEPAKKMYAIYHDIVDGSVFSRNACMTHPPRMHGVVRLCTIAAHDAAEALDILIALDGIDYEVPNNQK
jgi:hypothetical protein